VKSTPQRLNDIITAGFYPVFAVFLVWLWFFDRAELPKAVLVCGLSFVAVSLFRRVYNAPRPYEKDPSLPPPKPNAKRGQSFPSRHVFCAFLIVAAVSRYSAACGVLLALCAAALAYLRVRLRCHSVADVACGAALGLACGFLGFYLL
jgi:membrane-associated phospholipid phosphatase